jgi:hypothetical protein
LEVRASEEHKHWLPFFRSPPLRGAQALRVTLRRWRGWGSEWLLHFFLLFDHVCAIIKLST